MTHLLFTDHGHKFSELLLDFQKISHSAQHLWVAVDLNRWEWYPAKSLNNWKKQVCCHGTHRSWELREGFPIFSLLKVHYICIMTKLPSPIEALSLCFLLGVRQYFPTHLNIIRVKVWMLKFLPLSLCSFSMCLVCVS